MRTRPRVRRPAPSRATWRLAWLPLVMAVSCVLPCGRAEAQSAGAIAGAVTDAATGAPLAGVSVQVYSATGRWVGQQPTDVAGGFLVTGLPAGAYYVKTDRGGAFLDELYAGIPCPGGGCEVTTGTAVIVSAGAMTAHVDFGLARGGTITGVVRDAATGAPMAEIPVEACGASGTWQSWQARTNALGAYAVSGLAAGAYYVKTRAGAPHLDQLYDGVRCPDGSCEVTAGTGVGVAAGSTTAGIDFALQAGGIVSGTVTDASTGAPLASVQVDVYAWNRARAGGGRTDALGHYAAAGLPAGTYYVRTDAGADYLDEVFPGVPCPDVSCAVTTGSGVPVTAGATTPGIDFALGAAAAAGGAIAGTVTDAGTGSPLAGIPVGIYTPAGGWAGWAPTDVHGAYTKTGLAPGTYYVRTSGSLPYVDQLYAGVPCPDGGCTLAAGTAVIVTAGATAANIDFGLERGGTIAGMVTDTATGAPLAGVAMRVFTSSGGSASRDVVTNALGAYAASGLPTGTYYVASSDAFPFVEQLYDGFPCPGGTCAVTAGTGVGVTAGATTAHVDLALTRGGTITGIVTDAATGAPLAGVAVRVLTASGGSASRGVMTNAAGVYTAPGLATGTYYVATSNAFPFVDQLHDGVPCPGGECDIASGTGVGAAAGATLAGIDFSMVRGGVIAGAVTDAGTGAPLPGISVMAYTAAGAWAGQAWTNASGRYQVPGLATGSYYVRTSNAYPHLDRLFDGLPCPAGSCTVTSGSAVAVTAGATTANVDFGLARGGSIGGTVTDAARGWPLAGAAVEVFTEAGAWAGRATTNDAGAYVAQGLASGSYFVRTSNTSPYIDELHSGVSCPRGSCTVTAGAGVVVSEGSAATGIDFGLDLGGWIAGTVTDSAGGAPLGRIEVQAFDASGNPAAPGAFTNAAGGYAIVGLQAGTYYLRTSNSLAYLDELYHDLACCGGSCAVTSGTGVAVAAGAAVAAIDIGLTRGGAIAGTVTDAWTGAPLGGVVVEVYTASGGWAGQALTNAAGIYTKAGLPAGTYYLRTANNAPYLAELYDGLPCPRGACAVTAGAGVSVTAGATAGGIDFALAAAGPGGGDFTGDRKSDILWRHTTGGDVWLWPMNGAARVSETYVRTVSDTNWEIRGQGDQNGDGTADLLWRNTANGQVYYWPMNGNTPLDEIYVTTVDPAYDIVGTGDVDGDGKSDILWRHTAGGELWIWRMDGATPLSEVYVDRVDPAYVVKGVGDLDGDGMADIVWHHAATGEVWVWRMEGTTRLDQVWVGSVPDTGYRIQGVADFTGDGKADLLWWHATLGEVWIWTMNGPTRVAETWVGTVPETAYRIAGTGDYDGDGQADILWHHATRGEVWVWLMDGTIKRSETHVGTVADVGYRIVR